MSQGRGFYKHLADPTRPIWDICELCLDFCGLSLHDRLPSAAQLMVTGKQ